MFSSILSNCIVNEKNRFDAYFAIKISEQFASFNLIKIHFILVRLFNFPVVLTVIFTQSYYNSTCICKNSMANKPIYLLIKVKKYNM